MSNPQDTMVFITYMYMTVDYDVIGPIVKVYLYVCMYVLRGKGGNIVCALLCLVVCLMVGLLKAYLFEATMISHLDQETKRIVMIDEASP